VLDLRLFLRRQLLESILALLPAPLVLLALPPVLKVHRSKLIFLRHPLTKLHGIRAAPLLILLLRQCKRLSHLRFRRQRRGYCREGGLLRERVLAGSVPRGLSAHAACPCSALERQ
jgi:hypothetical protein